MLSKKVFTFMLCFVVFCESAFVDTLKKCSKDDGECQKQLMQSVIHDIHNGVEELGIPSIDPVQLENVSVNIIDVINVTLIQGVAKGAKNCIINKYTPNIEEGKGTLDITCDFLIKGKYKLFSESPLIQNLLGGKTIHGDGTGKIKITKINMVLTMLFDVVKKGEDIFLEGKKGKLSYVYNILGGVHFAANNLYLGDEEASDVILKLLNDNWKTMMEQFGRKFIDVALEYLFDFTQKFFGKVPTKHYIIEDLSQYVKN